MTDPVVVTITTGVDRWEMLAVWVVLGLTWIKVWRHDLLGRCPICAAREAGE